MSLEDAKAFLDKMKEDEEFRGKVIAARDKDARMKCVQDEGFHFSVEEFKQCNEELTPEELSHIAGGVMHCECPCDWFSLHWG